MSSGARTMKLGYIGLIYSGWKESVHKHRAGLLMKKEDAMSCLQKVLHSWLKAENEEAGICTV